MSSTSLYETTPQTGTVSTTNLTSLYSNTTNFTSGVVNSSVYSVNGGTGVTVDPTTGNVLVSIGQSVATSANPVFAGATLGNVTVGVADNQTITTTTNRLVLESATGEIDTGNSTILSTNSSSFLLLNFPTTVTAFNSATSLQLGANGGLTNINGTLEVDQGIITNNISIAVGDNNTITTVSGDLNLTATAPGNVSITSETNEPTRITRNSGSTNIAVRSLALAVQSSGTPAAGFGNSLEYEIETAVGNTERAGYVAVISEDVTPGSEDFRMIFGLMTGGVAADTKMSLNNAGDLTLDGGIRVLGSTSGSSIFEAPATGSVLSYVLPGTAGAASTVLTNDGSGNLTWALPGGGGSTFGNITVAVVNDNTISTTTGDLDITATGNNGVNITSGSDAPTLITRNSAVTNTTIRGLALNAQTSLTPAVGFGNSLEYQVEAQPGNTERAGFISVVSTDLTVGSEDFKMSFGLMAAGATYAEKAFLDSTGSLTLDNDLTVGGNNVNLAQDTAFSYSENNNRLNRPSVISTTGNTSGWRVRAPNATTSAAASLSVSNTNDASNNKFLSVQSTGSTTEPFRIVSGEYIAGVLNASGDSISIRDGVTQYATINPAGPTVGTDLTTKTYVDAAVAGGVTSITGTADQVIASSSTGAVTLSLPQSIATTSNVTFADVIVGDDLTVQGNNVNLAQGTIVGYSENDIRTNRPNIQSTTGDSSGFRVLAPNTTTSASGESIAFGSSDIDNGEFLSFRASGSTTDPFSIRTGKYTAGVFGASTKSIRFVDGTTTYASVNPSGPTIGTDLTTKTYVDGLIPTVVTYDFNATSTTGGANLNLVGSNATTDTVKLTNGGYITATYTSGTEVTLGSNATDAATPSTIVARDGSGNFSAGGATLGAVTVGVTTDNTIDTTSGNLTLQTAVGVNAGTLVLTAGANGAITLAPNGTGNVVNTFSNGGNLTNNRNYVFGAIRNATTAAAGDVWNFNATGAVGPLRGISLDNSADTTKNPGEIIRSYSGSAATGQRGRLVFEKARNTAASPTANQAADLLGSIEATGYSSTGWVNDTIPVSPGTMVFACAENWVSNTNLGTTYSLNLAPTATTISTVANLVNVVNVNPQLNQGRSDSFTWGSGKSATTFTATGSSISSTTLTIGTVTAGTVAVGQFIQTAINGILFGTYIVSNISGLGSGSTWVVSRSQTVGSTTITGTSGAMYLNSSGDLDVLGGITARGTSISGVNLGTTYANFATGSASITTSGRFTVTRTTNGSGLLLTQQVATANPADNDQMDFRIGITGTSTSSNFAKIDGFYKTSGDNEIGMSVSTDSFVADSDRIYIGSRASTKILATPSGGGTVSTIVDVTDSAVLMSRPVKFPTYTVAAAGAITGAVGWQISISNSSTSPSQSDDGMMAYWATNGTPQWRYIHNNGAL